MPHPSDLRWGLVAGEEDQRAFGVVEVQGALKKSGEKGQERLPEAGYGAAGLVCDEVASASEKELQLGEGALFLGSEEFGEVAPHARLIGDEAGVPLVGFGLRAVGVAGTVHGDEAGNIDHPLPPLPQEGHQEERRAPPPGWSMAHTRLRARESASSMSAERLAPRRFRPCGREEALCPRRRARTPSGTPSRRRRRPRRLFP